MNPAKRKKLYRKKLTEQKNISEEPKKVEVLVEQKQELLKVETPKTEETVTQTEQTQLSGILKKKKVVNEPV